MVPIAFKSTNISLLGKRACLKTRVKPSQQPYLITQKKKKKGISGAI